MMPRYNSGMDIKEIRKENFDRLLAEFGQRKASKGERGTLKRFAECYGLDPRHASQMKNGSRDIGDAIARRLEQNHKPALRDGWMDVQHGPGVPQNEVEEEVVEIALSIYRQSPAELLRIIRGFQKKTID